MIDKRDISAIRIEFRGHEPPHEFTLTVEGFCRELVDDLTMRVVHERLGVVAADLAASLERAVMSVARRQRALGAGKEIETEDIEI